MRTEWLLAAACLLAAGGAGAASQSTSVDKHVCECGALPPAPPRDRTVAPYAGQPQDLRPYSKFEQPYFENYIEPNIYYGSGRDIPEPKDITEVRIGFLGPLDPSPDKADGTHMLHGAQLAVEEANARGGYGGKPFKLMVHNDYNNWQAKAVYGASRPNDESIWGSAGDEAVKMIYDEEDWAIFGSISSESTHITLRIALKAEIPIVNSASTDPTIPETYIPWFFTDLQDDRVQSYTLARHIFTELGLKRVAILRVNERYGRLGVPYLRAAARRLGHPIVIEQKFLPGDKDFSQQLRVIQSSRVDAIVLWTDETPAATILREMRQMGMEQRVFGSYRTLGDTLLQEAGPAAEGFEAVFPYDPTRNDSRWIDFQSRFQARFHEPPEQFASLAYDAMNQLLDSICRAGLNRARIHDALASIQRYEGVTGTMVYDPNLKNVSPMYLGTVHNGAITYRPASMERQNSSDGQSGTELETPQGARVPAPTQERPPSQTTQPYARVGEDGVGYFGPQSADTPASESTGPLRVVIFGPDAAAWAQTAEMSAALKVASAAGTTAAAPRWELIPIESSQNWGNASAQLVQALTGNHPLAIVALDRDSAHLSEQLAVKTFIPVVAIAGDKTLTSTNIPWIFRLPADSSAAVALRLIEAGYRAGGRDPGRLRTTLASGNVLAGMAFTTAGEPLGK